MKRPFAIAACIVIALGICAGAGFALLRTSFISFKNSKAAGPGAAATALDASLPAKITFNEHIQPILSENCYFCHGQDATARKADLRVDRPEFAFLPRKNGLPVIVKGQPDTSALIQRIASQDPNQVMPPPSSHKAPLTPRQVALITRWVREGAKYEEHWAFVKPVRAPLPPVNQAAWVRNPIDQFVLAKLEAHHFTPEPEADRRTLLRRVTLDLTGLPPTPEEISAFLADQSPGAYEKVVDRLLASPHYGEHEGRYWLDAARYAETVGLHFDEPRSIWPYRDWVIKAFNDNKPFDTFVKEQVAGDLLPNHTLEQQVATGFTRCGLSTSEGGSIEDEVLASYAKENVETNATVFMGLTMGCCACHDHKFDPISQREFYQFSAFFRNTTQRALGPRTDASIPPYIRVPAQADRARWEALPAEQAEAQKAVDDYQAHFAKDAKDRLPAIVQALVSGSAAGKPVAAQGLVLQLPMQDGTGEQLASSAGPDAPRTTGSGANAGAVLASGTGPSAAAITGTASGVSSISGTASSEIATSGTAPSGVASSATVPSGKSYQITGNARWSEQGLLGPALVLDGSTSAEFGNIADFDLHDRFSLGGWIRMSGTVNGPIFSKMDRADNNRGWELALDSGRVAVRFVNYSPRGAFNPISLHPLAQNTWQHLFITYDGSGNAAGLKIYLDGLPQESKATENNLEGTIRTAAQFTLGRHAEASSSSSSSHVSIQDLRIYARVLTPAEIKTLAGYETMQAVLKTPFTAFTEPQRQFALRYYLENLDPRFAPLHGRLVSLKAEYDAIANRSPATMVMDDKPTPAFAFLLKRGQYDQKGEKLSPGVPKVLPPMPKDAPNNRLGLAMWLTSPENPLLSRVTVNRFWQQFFGIGIVRTAEDFGLMGERPVNQPLLDWLAVEFRESGWDVKHLVRLIVTSSAYRQSDHVTAEKRESDPENRLISRGPRFRLDAEVIRDQALAASGLLQPQIGGPSVKPYQPPGLWEVVSMSNEKYVADKGPSLYRRSMYTYIKRLAPHPQLTTFDAPTRELCTVRRERTDTPLQALAMENDPQYMEAARHLAVHAIQAASTPAARLDYMAERLLARPLADKEKSILLASLDHFSQTYTAQPAAAAKVIQIGDSPVETAVPAPEQAAWTMVASEFLNLDETLNK